MSKTAEIAEIVKGKHSHYYKDVRHLHCIDVYRTLKLFNVTDPAIAHAVKKLLCAGGRGVKDIQRDVQEAIDTLVRYREMCREDEIHFREADELCWMTPEDK